MRHLISLLAFFFAARFAAALEITPDVPATVDPQARYLIHLVGMAAELQGPDAFSPYYRKTYQTSAISRTFRDAGYNVITEPRTRATDVDAFAKKVADQVGRLLAAGIPPRQIKVVGFSKGAVIAEHAARYINQAEICYALLGGCPRQQLREIAGEHPRASYEAIVTASAGRMRGRILSMYDAEDGEMGSCSELATANPELKFEERKLSTNSPRAMGHAIFFDPNEYWVPVLMDWLNKTP